jgi:hypothetical protein
MREDKIKEPAMAMCNHKIHGEWKGQIRYSYGEAQKDADRHNDANPGHEAYVERILQPVKE